MEKRRGASEHDKLLASPYFDSEKSKGKIPKGGYSFSTLISLLIVSAFVCSLLFWKEILHVALVHESVYHVNHLTDQNHENPHVINIQKATSPLLAVSSDQLDSAAREKQATGAAEKQQTVIHFRALNDQSLQPPPSSQQQQQLQPSEEQIKRRDELEKEVNLQVGLIRKMKFIDHLVMETNTEAIAEITKLQTLLREFVVLKYGPEPYLVNMTVLFPEIMRREDRPLQETIMIRMAPLALAPYSTYYFLNIVEQFKGGQFHRNAGHVLQAQVNSHQQGLAFQEYNPRYPHVRYTLGYAGRPGGPAFYISTVDNTQIHGPASQGSNTEADASFGSIEPAYIPVVKRMQKQPGGGKGSGFISDSKNFIKILSLKLIR